MNALFKRWLLVNLFLIINVDSNGQLNCKNLKGFN